MGPAGAGAPHRVGSQLFRAIPCLRFPVSGAACQRLGSRTGGSTPVLGLSGVSASLGLDFLCFQLGVGFCGSDPAHVARRGSEGPGDPGGGRRIVEQLGLEGALKTVSFQPREAGGGFLSSPIGMLVCVRWGRRGRGQTCPSAPHQKTGLCPAVGVGKICPGAGGTLWLFPSSR